MKIVTVRTDNQDLVVALRAVVVACQSAAAEHGLNTNFADFSIFEEGPRVWNFLFNQRSLAAELGITGDAADKFISDLQMGITRKSIIHLIKAVRNHTGMGLKESKAIIDRYTA